MEKLRNLKPILFFHLILNGSVLIFITGASYYHTPLEGFKDTAIYTTHLLVLQTTVAGILYFLSLNKWVFRILFTAFFLGYCGFSFWAYTQDVSVTLPLIHSVIETTPDIAFDIITIPFVLFFLVALAALYYVLKLHSKIQHKKGLKALVLPALIFIGLFFLMEQKRPGSLKNRLPYNVAYGLADYFKKSQLLLNSEIPDLIFKEDSLKMVFVLGETVRADHIGLNGYERNTTPNLSLKENIFSTKYLFTDYTYTGASLPQILTDKSLAIDSEINISVFDVIKKANFKTTWIGNQTLEKSFSPIVNTNENIILVDKYKSDYSFEKELDEAMFPPLDSILKTNPRQIVTLHMIGSHWWYENRYTEKHRKYKPVIKSKYVPSLTEEQLINSYDNTILYLDNFLFTIINNLEKEKMPTLLFYVSDHGEHLGEDGVWLHAQSGDAAKNPAYLIWFSEKYKEKYPEKVARIFSLRNEKQTTDVIFYQMLDLLDITIVEK